MKRRKFITLLGGAVACPLAARAQQAVAKMPRIGIIDPGSIWDPFRQGLRDLGYIEGRDITIDIDLRENGLSSSSRPRRSSRSCRWTSS
jgi:putative ABC transport system substrate-binding protein